MNTIYTPYFPIHPGEMLKDELSARGIKQKQFAEVIGVSYSLLNEVFELQTSDFGRPRTGRRSRIRNQSLYLGKPAGRI